MVHFKTLNDINVKNKTVIVRVDFNSEIDPQTKQVTNGVRICAHAQFTLKELIEKGAKIVVLSHQGRKGDPDYTDLKQHAEILEKMLKHPVKYVDDLFNEEAQSAVKQLKEGEIVVLENVRSWSEETKKGTTEQQSKTALIQNLAPLADFFINDAFSVAHRDNVSMIGFTAVLPSVAGRIMERELTQLNKVLENPQHPCIYVMGGAKADDSLEISKYILHNNVADKLLLGGIISQLFMTAKGLNLGKGTMVFLEKKGLLDLIPGIQELLTHYSDKIILPVDIALNVDGKRLEIPVNNLPSEHPIFDIGTKTVEKYIEIISTAQSIVVSGPLGVYENNNFCYGTKTIFETIANSKTSCLAGGGNTIAALDQYNLTSKISYISTAGGALVEALMGKKLPGVVALETATETKALP
ncbi:MAG: phosphoglycerate kinase [Candidatus Bathyarchaeota archaeon]|nr:phosphoglycerate kinase [Candidatus Termiticorpusculum sp.]MCL1970174.1 phosphoglycerate kinase [Candidatus Termiticorpusculum sp.]